MTDASPGELRDLRDLRDTVDPRPVVATRDDFAGRIWTVRTDDVDLGAAGVVTRDYVVHPGAVAVIALDDDDRVLLVRQYRHPVRSLCWEPPAGIRDVEGEPLVDTARRELAEETGWSAGRWFELVAFDTTPGGSSEHLTVFLARDLAPMADADLHAREGEEHGMTVAWWPLDDVLDGILDGRLANPSLVAGVLAAAAHRGHGWRGLRPA